MEISKHLSQGFHNFSKSLNNLDNKYLAIFSVAEIVMYAVLYSIFLYLLLKYNTGWESFSSIAFLVYIIPFFSFISNFIYGSIAAFTKSISKVFFLRWFFCLCFLPMFFAGGLSEILIVVILSVSAINVISSLFYLFEESIFKFFSK